MSSPDIWRPLVDEDFVNRIRHHVSCEILPHADAIDKDDFYPVDIIRGLAKAGFIEILLPKNFGGEGRFELVAALFEEVGYASAATGVSLISIFQSLTMLSLFGSDSLISEYRPKYREGLIASYALTEANHGSDIRSLDTKAVRDGQSWILNGEKSFITSGSAAEFLIILAETDIGVSAFALPYGLPGCEKYVGEFSATIGLRNGPHVNMRLNDVRLPLDHLIGTEGKGVRQAVTVLDYSRTFAAAISVGIGRAAFDGALARATGRTAFDQTISSFQGIQWYFAEMLADIDAARLLVYRAARALDDHEDIARHSSTAKLIASRVATEVASKAIQIGGAWGTSVNTPFGRYFRDAKTYEIGGGSSEILKNTIAKFLIGRMPK
ncbi:alkylation response protein AidB-like acyl-CoA dehydrogenase [Sphingomonas vulcanisoli]|uniref:Alkylation response protein AidB-like acyl-CoA dehydrogenase n=1 Tax=Sphingomonas vulcanisoli TaxID=1658060 RepID=A0ABX0TTC6_9SPHN|nr:acyl-CoA dehydrogenase family protein [Sphingomonas vulcanisoli]NIJ08747.1 alkylation response protein AidB-like acyl-CoA dehydrogenase [Sphingomonas vulcanisoli]